MCTPIRHGRYLNRIRYPKRVYQEEASNGLEVKRKVFKLFEASIL
ncbi:hypothetical protein B4098_1040 [Heyndrickxia coagulans]|uniref:Uncharacterized protein n=1 Tax=Heyndrickxia coagulans TaxID=1398 RepID=A0A150KHU9_HEYCO|nr:hypothetical protein B4098_1040 [Heyndrickxia coagulans]KYC71498.1 hypothetical protein B4099_1156 [Heyndrickxia coagulans]